MTDFQDDIEQWLDETFGHLVPQIQDVIDLPAEQPETIPVLEGQQIGPGQFSHGDKRR